MPPVSFFLDKALAERELEQWWYKGLRTCRKIHAVLANDHEYYVVLTPAGWFIVRTVAPVDFVWNQWFREKYNWDCFETQNYSDDVNVLTASINDLYRSVYGTNEFGEMNWNNGGARYTDHEKPEPFLQRNYSAIHMAMLADQDINAFYIPEPPRSEDWREISLDLFVFEFYQDILGRVADDQGLQYWVNWIQDKMNTGLTQEEAILEWLQFIVVRQEPVEKGVTMDMISVWLQNWSLRVDKAPDIFTTALSRSEEEWPEIPGINTSYYGNVGIFIPDGYGVDHHRSLLMRNSLSQYSMVPADFVDEFVVLETMPEVHFFLETVEELPIIGGLVGMFREGFLNFIWPKVRAFGRQDRPFAPSFDLLQAVYRRYNRRPSSERNRTINEPGEYTLRMPDKTFYYDFFNKLIKERVIRGYYDNWDYIDSGSDSPDSDSDYFDPFLNEDYGSNSPGSGFDLR